ncbi:hypothetical protein DFH07DRAFT_963811 [Mycena maculata]|uniref:Uncharacterized protein n=1 Tax=Mycena maculata TaxID=230809 RepID=A0AAD7IJ10_9AGAR|nr:hypothetical protein DFH07DRAFT_963811 [Mycena maculata]
MSLDNGFAGCVQVIRQKPTATGAVTNLLLDVLTTPSRSCMFLALATLVLSSVYLFSTEELLVMLESQMSPDNWKSSLATIDSVLPTPEIAAPRLQRFAGLRSMKYLKLVCLDEARLPIQVIEIKASNKHILHGMRQV